MDFICVGFITAKKNVVQQNTENIHNQYNQNNNNKRVIHEKVYKTGAGDIRGILRDKYTIAE